MARSISTIAREIQTEWSKTKSGVHYTAKPYLDALKHLDTIKDSFYEDDAKGVIIYFLSNASSYRGPVAKAHKAELRAIAGLK